MRLGWWQRHSAGAARHQPPERLGGRADSFLKESARTAVSGIGAHGAFTELFHLADDADAERSREVAAARHRGGGEAHVTPAPPPDGGAPDRLHSAASMRRRGGRACE